MLLDTLSCVLCNTHFSNNSFIDIAQRTLYYCPNCFLIFTDKKHYVNEQAEKKRYLQHNNNIDNLGYISFLNQIVKPSLEYLNPSMHGLDYGCGPGPAINFLLKKESIKCDIYDPIFFPEINNNTKYDFIFATECFEHFFYPSNEIRKISSLLKQNGYLLIMTELYNESTNFSKWYYANDPTHVLFFHAKTIEFICAYFHYSLIYTDNKHVFILRKT